jgi:hypothetical protein
MTTQQCKRLAGWWIHAFAWMHRWWVEYWACSIVGIALLQRLFCDEVHTKSLATEKNNLYTDAYSQVGLEPPSPTILTHSLSSSDLAMMGDVWI